MYSPRALSLRNLVLGYGRVRVFPVGKGWTHPQEKQTTGCLRHSVGRSRCGGDSVEDGFHKCVLYELQSGRGRCNGKPCRAPQHAQACCCIYCLVSKHQIRRGRRAARWSTSRWSAEPFSATTEGANREVFEGKADIFLRGPTRSG